MGVVVVEVALWQITAAATVGNEGSHPTAEGVVAITAELICWLGT